MPSRLRWSDDSETLLLTDQLSFVASWNRRSGRIFAWHPEPEEAESLDMMPLRGQAEVAIVMSHRFRGVRLLHWLPGQGQQVRQVGQTLLPHYNAQGALAGRQLLRFNTDYQESIYDLRSGAPVAAPNAPTPLASLIQASDDERYWLYKVFNSGSLLYDKGRDRVLCQWEYRREPLVINADSRTLIVSEPQGYRLWRIEDDGCRPVTPLWPRQEWQLASGLDGGLRFSNDSRQLAAFLSSPWRVAVFDLPSRRRLGQIKAMWEYAYPDESDLEVCFPPGSRELFIYKRFDVEREHAPDEPSYLKDSSRELIWWDPISGRQRQAAQGKLDDTSAWERFFFTPDCRYLTLTEAHRLQIWDLSRDRFHASLPQGDDPWNSQTLYTDRRMLIKESAPNTLAVWDLASQNKLFDLPVDRTSKESPWSLYALRPERLPVHLARSFPGSHLQLPDETCCALSASGRYLIDFGLEQLAPGELPGGDSRPGFVKLYDLRTRRELKLPESISDLYRFSVWQRDGHEFLAAVSQESLQVWDLADGRLIRRWDNGSAFSILALTVSPDQETLAVLSSDGLIRLWRTLDFSLSGEYRIDRPD